MEIDRVVQGLCFEFQLKEVFLNWITNLKPTKFSRVENALFENTEAGITILPEIAPKEEGIFLTAL